MFHSHLLFYRYACTKELGAYQPEDLHKVRYVHERDAGWQSGHELEITFKYFDMGAHALKIYVITP